MKVVLVNETFSKRMGYLENTLPRYLGRLGAEVHVVTTGLPPNYQNKDFYNTYQAFTGDQQQIAGLVEAYDGYTLHTLPHKMVLGYPRIVGLSKKLRTLQPDIVQTTVAIGWIPLDCFFAKQRLGFKLFTGNHTHASVFPLSRTDSKAWSFDRIDCAVRRGVPGRLVSFGTEKCYAISKDCADIATRFFGVQEEKVSICPLGVDTDIFKPSDDAAAFAVRESTRQELGFSKSEIVCVYSGRFSEDKNPLILANAIAILRRRLPNVRGLFVGEGVQAEAIRAIEGCAIHPFVDFTELGSLYRASDIGVWPTQESMSMIDAAACGLPIIVNNQIGTPERVKDNGLLYELNDVNDLARAIEQLCNPKMRSQMGAAGARQMATEYAMEVLTRHRMADYKSSMARG